MEKLRELFLAYLTKNNETNDAMCFNRAIFKDASGEYFGRGMALVEVNLGMVMAKFDMAVDEYQKLYGKYAANNYIISKKTIQ